MMSDVKAVVRVTELQPTPTGLGRVLLYDGSKRKKKRGAKLIRLLEREVVQFARVQKRMSQMYIDYHDRSNVGENNGWLFEFERNVLRAIEKGGKRVR